MFESLFGKADDPISRDADRLIQKMGEEAFTVAGELSWREDAGLLVVKRPGHWHLVQAEIGRRTGKTLPVSDIQADREKV